MPLTILFNVLPNFTTQRLISLEKSIEKCKKKAETFAKSLFPAFFIM